ncbi:MAG: Re/Si-specific NAD(P)(+) transhydrogenase subunit alpha [Gemmatimonadetes bacterium]|nr:Re/Si-specific NAD(P)(+) transhydrogenase subunit alpha [Gemmatimonadota bacterium]
MRVLVPMETAAGETRVALVPDSVKRLVASGIEVRVERGAGSRANLSDAAYEAAGAILVGGDGSGYEGADVVARVQRPSPAEAERLPEGSTLIALLQPAATDDLAQRLAARGVTALALERVPRITRAQSMDVLSSQATVAGYKAVLVGAMELDKFLPMLTTAAGSIAPARTFVIGAGVAGLQAIATARRLGAIVSAFDIRAAAAEQVRSLGATFVASEVVSAAAETAGGYAREQAEEEQQRTLATIGGHLPSVDLVITTAQIPGRPAPRLITAEMVATMRPGSVIVDLAAETGGNCAVTRLGETVDVHGVKVMGPTNLPATAPLHASQMFSRNVLTLLQHLIKDGALTVDLEDEITGAMTLSPAAGAQRP